MRVPGRKANPEGGEKRGATGGSTVGRRKEKKWNHRKLVVDPRKSEHDQLRKGPRVAGYRLPSLGVGKGKELRSGYDSRTASEQGAEEARQQNGEGPGRRDGSSPRASCKKTGGPVRSVEPMLETDG